MHAAKLTVIVQQAEHPRRAHAHVGRRIGREQRPDPIRRPRGAQCVHGMVADDGQRAVRSEVAERLDAMRADRCRALVRQARGERRQRQPLDQGPDRLRLPTKNQGVRGLLANMGALEGKRLDQGLIRDGAVLPAVGRRRARRPGQRDQNERSVSGTQTPSRNLG